MDENLIDQVVKATGLPEEKVKAQLHKWILETGRSPQDISLEDLREVLVILIQDLYCEIRSGENEFLKLSS